ncbi:14-3-3 protein theta [Myotis davidii]|uniref:14-3-3 protein theta n=1 Tax=Myotis davidii TaxID=225400 RepID=L5MD91_MYODS|nr:14-3-3 protein theta [Myotis davidii]
MSKPELIQKAKLAEQAQRYEDMATCMKAATEQGAELSEEERSLLWVAYGHVAGNRRSAWRVISSIEQKTDASDKKLQEVEPELRGICTTALELLDKHLIARASNPESKVFYLKVKGDHFRYLAEVARGDDRKQTIDNIQGAYQEAFDISKKELQPTHPIRLGLARDFSIFHYELLNTSELACALAKTAFDEAVADLHTLSDSHEDNTLVMQFLETTSAYGHRAAQEKNEMGQMEPKKNCKQSVILPPSRSLCAHLHPLLHLGFLEQRNPFVCMASTAYRLLTLQLWENSTP